MIDLAVREALKTDKIFFLVKKKYFIGKLAYLIIAKGITVYFFLLAIFGRFLVQCRQSVVEKSCVCGLHLGLTALGRDLYQGWTV